MSAPLVVNTSDGTCWTRREAVRDGQALYAPEKCPGCPEFVMATYAELEEHGIAGEAYALPMPAGPEPEATPADADRAKAPWGRGEDGRPRLPMSAHWTDVPELVDRNLAGIQARVDQAQPGSWFVSPTAEAPDTVCTQYDGYTRTVGRFTNVLPADLELVLHAHSNLRWCLDLIVKLRARVDEVERKYAFDMAELKRTVDYFDRQSKQRKAERDEARARVAELEAERHVTNEALSDADVQLSAYRARIAELERPAVERHRREVRESYRWLAAHAREDCDFEGETVVLQQLAERESLWKQEDDLAKEFAADPLALKPWTPGPSAEESAEKLTRLLAPTQALREDVPAALRAEDTADILTLAPVQHADATYDAAFGTIQLELTATSGQWVEWQKVLDVDLARTTGRGSCVTSHATWRGIHVVVRCWLVRAEGAPVEDLPEMGGAR